jgi:antitoxin component YwqK of YwqJK toxin-antitoxin module
MKSIYLLFTFVLFAHSYTSFSKPVQQKGFLWFKINKIDKEGRNHGRWKVHLGDDNIVIRNGRFRHGKEVGTWRYYYPSGQLYMKERYSRKSDEIKVIKYHENGNIARKGSARFIQTSTLDKYFWFGDWEVYDANGNFSHLEEYKQGILIRKK